MTFLMLLSVILLSMLMILLSVQSVIRHLICGNYLNWLLKLKWVVDFNAGKTQLVSFDRSNNTGSIDVKMDGSVLEETFLLTLGLSLDASLEPLAHRQNVASLSLFYRYYFGRCSSKQAQLVPRPFSQERSTCYSDRLHDFSVTIPRCYKDVYVNSFFPHTARLWNSLPIECFPLTYDLSGFKSRVNRHLLTVGSF